MVLWHSNNNYPSHEILYNLGEYQTWDHISPREVEGMAIVWLMCAFCNQKQTSMCQSFLPTGFLSAGCSSCLNTLYLSPKSGSEEEEEWDIYDQKTQHIKMLNGMFP